MAVCSPMDLAAAQDALREGHLDQHLAAGNREPALHGPKAGAKWPSRVMTCSADTRTPSLRCQVSGL